MKILLLLIAMVLGFCLACKETFDYSTRIAQQQMSMPATNPGTELHPQTIALR
jgi:hypothetical protein